MSYESLDSEDWDVRLDASTPNSDSGEPGHWTKCDKLFNLAINWPSSLTERVSKSPDGEVRPGLFTDWVN